MRTQIKKVKEISTRTFASLRIRNYRLYFTGQAISLSGNWMQTIGQAWLVLQITGSGTQLGLVTAIQFLPMLVLGPVGGLIVDRFPKRKLLYFTQGVSAMLALTLAMLVATNTIELWMVYVLALLLGLVNAVDNPARQTFVTELVGKDNLANAVSLNAIEINLARVAGPAVAGALIASVGMAPLFFINAASFIAVIFSLRAMRTGEFFPTTVVVRAAGQLMEGFRYVRSNPVIARTLLMMAIIGTFTYEFTVNLPLIAQFTFNGTAGTYATLTGALGVGSMLGGFYTAGRKLPPYKIIVATALAFGVSVLVAAVMPTFTLMTLALVVVGFFAINFLSYGNVTLQLESKPEMRGRVMALWATAFLGSTPIGGPIVGWIGQNFGPRYGLIIGGIAAIAVAAIIGTRPLKKKLSEPETDIETPALA